MKPSILQRRLVYALAALAVLAAAGTVIVRGGPGAVPVSTSTVARTEIQPLLFGLGVVEARRTILVGPSAAGRVSRVLVEQGDRVEAGQLLAEMDPVDLRERLAAGRQALARARSSLAAARAQAQEAESRWVTADASALRYASLRERGFVSAEAERAKGHEARAAEAALRGSGAGIDAALADAARLAAEAAAVERQLANTRLVAAAPGLVLAREADPGSTVVAGQAVLRLAEGGALWLRVRLDQGRSAGLAVGLPASVVLRSRPAERFTGRLARIERMADAVTEERVAMVVLDAPPAGLSVNEIAEVTLALPARQQVLAVPPAALARQDGRLGAYVVEAGRARFHPVRAGLRTEEAVEILDGLAEGSIVVTRRSRPVADGDRVRVEGHAGAPG